MKDGDPVLSTIRGMRRAAGLTQATLAHRAGVCLATLQKIEAGTANPALATLRKLLAVLGLDLEAKPRAVDWGALVRLGLPLRGDRVAGGDADPARLPVLVRQAALALASQAEQGAAERYRDALQAFLFALRAHFPTTYRRHFAGCPQVEALTPTRPTGRGIKLGRIAKQRLAEVL